MIPVLDSEGMRRCDAETIEQGKVPSLALMEVAASAVTEVVRDTFADAGRVLVLCGPGNNGGDGLAAARQLHGAGWHVEVLLTAGAGSMKADAGVQLAAARASGVRVDDLADGVALLAQRLEHAPVVIDAMFGTGLDRPLDGRDAAIVAHLNASGVPVVAVDIPSGLSGRRSDLIGPAVSAVKTVALAAPKFAHVLPPACWKCGSVVVADIGIPAEVLDRHARVFQVETADVRGWLPPRAPDAHKGDFGHLVLVAGRRGRAGAAALAARAGVLGGAGLVTVTTTPDAGAAVQCSVLEAMVDLCGVDEAGAMAALDVEALRAKATAVAAGPGMGTGASQLRVLESLLEGWAGPLVLDADALTLLAGRLGALLGRSGGTVLTPHPGELARILGLTVAEVVADRLSAALDAARQSGAIVVAKGSRTVVASPDGTALVNPTGTPGLASGGTGDTLTGLIGAFLAQGIGAREAAAAGVFLHGLAAELAGRDFPLVIPAGDLARYVPAAMRSVFGEDGGRDA